MERGWTPAQELAVGDQIAGELDGVSYAVEAVRQTEGLQPVFNVTVEEDHTYFVGAPDWGFAVWVHNAYSPKVVKETQQRPKRIIGKINPSMLGTGTSPSSAGRKYIASIGNQGDDAGHLIARILGGAGGKKSGNLHPMDSSLNRGKLSTFEKEIAGYMKQNNVKAKVNISLGYTGNSQRMSVMKYDVLFSDGERWFETFRQ